MDTIPTISCLRQLLDEDISRKISAEMQLKNSCRLGQQRKRLAAPY